VPTVEGRIATGSCMYWHWPIVTEVNSEKCDTCCSPFWFAVLEFAVKGRGKVLRTAGLLFPGLI
jgi:hypothetical protein